MNAQDPTHSERKLTPFTLQRVKGSKIKLGLIVVGVERDAGRCRSTAAAQEW